MNNRNAAQILQCPDCKEYVASDAQSCRFCRRQLDSYTIKMAVATNQRENRRYRRDHYAKHMVTGAGLFTLSAFVTFGTLWLATTSESGGYYVVAWGFMIGGIGDFLYGLYGLLSEVFSKK